MMAEYYSQRATAGLIVTEGTTPSPNGLGYARIPGLFNTAQVSGWKAVTDAVHGANGYLIEQFLNANVNRRDDEYGNSIAGRNRFALEVARATVAAVGGERVGIRLSPYGAFNSTGHFPEQDEQYLALARELSSIGLLYLHVLDHSSMGAPTVPAELKVQLRNSFEGLFILAGGFDQERAEKALVEKRADLIAFERQFLANPDLVARFRANAPLNAPDMATFYVPGAKGYTDYPTLAA
jgi:N-ethylmaleimide reductase